MKTRLISLFMVFCMVFSLMPVSALAEEPVADDLAWEEEAFFEENDAQEEPESELDLTAEEEFFEEPVIEDEFFDESAFEEDSFEKAQGAEENLPEDEALLEEDLAVEEALPEEEPVFAEHAEPVSEEVEPEEVFKVNEEETLLEPGEEDFLVLDAEEVTASADADDSVMAKGNCGASGDNLTWILDDEGTLTIRGTGKMANYSRSSPAPWDSKKDFIDTAIIKEGVTSIGDYAFDFSDLRKIELPESITRIGESAFSCCCLTRITIPNKVTAISDDAFTGCTSLVSVTIPDGVTKIGEGAFDGCSNLKKITLPDGVKSIGSQAFFDCSSLARITIPGGVKSIPTCAFHSCENLTDVTISPGVKNIEQDAFSGCRSLTEITLPESITSIEKYAFHSCRNLASITFPAGVEEIGEKAFGNCGSLKNIYFKGDAPVLVPNCFFDVTATAHFPCNANWLREDKEDYGGTLTWKKYHPYGEPVWTWNGTKATAVFTCLYNDHQLTKTPEVTSRKTLPTYTSAGKIVYTAKVTVNGETYTDTKTVKIAKLKLAKPASVTLKCVKTGMKVSWKAVEGAERYFVQKKVESGDWKNVGYKTGTSFTDKNVTSGKTYKYRVCANRKTDAVSGPYKASTAKTYIACPSAPILKNSAKGVLIKWYAVKGASQYRIQKKVGTGSWKKLTDTTDLKFTDTSVTSGTKYSYRIRCLDANGKVVNSFSSAKTIKVPCPSCQTDSDVHDRKDNGEMDRSDRSDGLQCLA